MSVASVLIAGATGSVGGEALRLAKAAGYRVTALSRSAASLRDIADRVIPFDATEGIPELAGHDAVISTLGAPVALNHKDRRPFRAVDFAGNLNILKAARRAGVARFVYVSLHVETGYAATAYALAHEEFVNALQASGMAYTIVRPTGIFSAFADFPQMVSKRGFLPVLGDGSARTNPVHQTDVAEACVASLEDGPAELHIGGPEIFTRRQIAELVFTALGKRPRIVRMPAAAMDLGGYLARTTNPRRGELLEFLSRVAVIDCIAPSIGTRRLEDYFQPAASVKTEPDDPPPPPPLATS